MNLLNKKCIPCELGGKAMSREDIIVFGRNLNSWKIVDDIKIIKEFLFKDFVQSMNFVNKVADIAEKEGHHPDISIFYNKVKIELTTHAVRGLTENDFILATKIDHI